MYARWSGNAAMKAESSTIKAGLQSRSTNMIRANYDVEGTLEVQRQLLSKLAAHENQAIAELGSDMCHRRLEALKADTVQAIQKTWSQSSKSPTYRRSIYF
jgi:hypothetical protein